MFILNILVAFSLNLTIFDHDVAKSSPFSFGLQKNPQFYFPLILSKTPLDGFEIQEILKGGLTYITFAVESNVPYEIKHNANVPRKLRMRHQKHPKQLYFNIVINVVFILI